MDEQKTARENKLKAIAFWGGLLLFLLTAIFFRPQLDLAGLKRSDPGFLDKAKEKYEQALEAGDTETLLTPRGGFRV